MRTLLRIDASARIDGSHSRMLADHVQKCWLAVNLESRVVMRDLAKYPIPHLDNETIESFQCQNSLKDNIGLILSDELIGELLAADDVLISSPLYNFSTPSSLKSYIDHVVRADRTFKIEDGRYVGLLKGRRAFLVTARGGIATPGAADDFQVAFLREILAFIGITTEACFSLDGMALDAAERSHRMSAAKSAVDRIFFPDLRLEVAGAFSADDLAAIAALRDGQARAILDGDAAAYARLCTDDVRLMIPGSDIVSGRSAVQAAEKKLFESARFAVFRKRPERIERSGEFVVETGDQEVAATGGGASGVFTTRQKYTHVYRRTPDGWRFAVLMSNSSE